MQCSLDVGYAALNLAYLDPKEAMELEFNTEYFYLRREKIENSTSIYDSVVISKNEVKE